jgi:cysteine desulfurase
MKEPIYLDYAAATPLNSKVLEAMQPYFSDKFYNPSATYLAARDVRLALDQARADTANVIGARPAEIIFTAGGTEANNLAIQGIMRAFPDGEVLVSAVEHQSVLAPAELFNHKTVPVLENGIIDINGLENLISDKIVLVSLMLVNNELGTLQPIKEIAQIIKKVRLSRLSNGNKLPLYLHTDAAQAGNYLDLHVSRLTVDLMTINGSKIYGPKQTGFLFVKTGVQILPLIVGGGQERNMRSGTENIAGFVGLAKALSLAQDSRGQEAKRVTELREYFERELKSHFPAAIINGSVKHRAPHIVNVTFPGVDNERLMMELDERGVQVAVGSACSASSEEPSHVLSAIGLKEELARSTIRFSLGKNTTHADLEYTLAQLQGLQIS